MSVAEEECVFLLLGGILWKPSWREGGIRKGGLEEFSRQRQIPTERVIQASAPMGKLDSL